MLSNHKQPNNTEAEALPLLLSGAAQISKISRGQKYVCRLGEEEQQQLLGVFFFLLLQRKTGAFVDTTACGVCQN